ncbi:MAG TPA: type II toxin-antitoxin system CcdA family antitoxin [Acetobacteraceae bacterium]|nr:type II toxin-antitoxin system CcdA family antitoxin [Acetobacteraceae bacterium]
MRTPLYDLNARRKTVSITLNADLAAKAAAAGINLSRTAEDAIAKAFVELERERVKIELLDAMQRVAAYVALYGRPFDDWTADAVAQSDEADGSPRRGGLHCRPPTTRYADEPASTPTPRLIARISR